MQVKTVTPPKFFRGANLNKYSSHHAVSAASRKNVIVFSICSRKGCVEQYEQIRYR